MTIQARDPTERKVPRRRVRDVSNKAENESTNIHNNMYIQTIFLYIVSLYICENYKRNELQMIFKAHTDMDCNQNICVACVWAALGLYENVRRKNRMKRKIVRTEKVGIKFKR